MSPEELRVREEAAFGTFLRALQDGQCPGESEDDGGGAVAPFEHNLEVRGDMVGDTGGGLGTKGSQCVSPFPPQTWRQLWRVLEMSDIILLITDARHPVSTRGPRRPWRGGPMRLGHMGPSFDPFLCLFPKVLNVPPALAAHVTRELGKGLILILNKVDLTSPAVATAWSHLLRRRFPNARVVPFTSAPRRSPVPGRYPRQGG